MNSQRLNEVAPFGDSHVRIVLNSTNADVNWLGVHALAKEVNRGLVPGFVGAIATFDSVIMQFDPCVLLPDEALRAARSLVVTTPPADYSASSLFRIPVLFDLSAESDLLAVAAGQGITPANLIERLCAQPLLMRCYTHQASAMLDAPRFARPVPRRADPRVKVPAGSVSLAGGQSVVMTVESPSGWQVVGRTPLKLYTVGAHPFTPYSPGDRFHYAPISQREWTLFEGRHLKDFHE